MTGGATPPPAPQAWRAGDNAPAWARGKTSEEILGIAEKLVDSFQRYGGPSPAEQAAQAQYNAAHSTPPAQTESVSIGDEDYVTGATLKRVLADAAARNVQPGISQSIDLAASANFGVLQQRYAKDFQRFGPEIATKLATVPKTMWTLDNLETVVKLVRSDHLDELARERAAEFASSVEPTIRSSGLNASVPVPTKEHSLESEKIPVEWKRRAERAGVTEDIVRDFCAANDMPVADFYKQFDAPATRIAEDVRLKDDIRTERARG